MRTTNANKPTARPLTVAVPDPVYRRVRIYCASKDLTLSAFVTSLFERATADLPAELADVMAPASPESGELEVAS